MYRLIEIGKIGIFLGIGKIGIFLGIGIASEKNIWNNPIRFF